MGQQRKLEWSRTLSDLKTERARLPEVRAETLKAIIGGRNAVSWRGVSGRRYVFAVFGVDRIDLADDHPSVVVAVKPSADARSEIISTRAYPAGDQNYKLWLAECVRRGACEIHQHRLADSDEERRQVAIDLRPLPPRVA